MSDSYKHKIAEYKKQQISDYAGNPMIEALPLILDSEEKVINAFKLLPQINEEDSREANRIKAHILQRVKKLIVPLPIHLQLESIISVLIRNSYIYRNPISKEYIQELNELSNLKENADIIMESGMFEKEQLNHPAQCMFINGLSGMGKTTAIDRILSFYPQVIRHEKYNGVQFVRTQLTWIKIDCPYDGNFITLCRSVFSEIDRVVGERYLEKYGYLTRSASTMIMHLTHLLKIYNVGMLVIDEMQNLLNGKDDPNKMLDFFVTLTNMISLPVIFVGTNKARTLFQKNLRLARRVQSDGYIEMRNIEKNSPTWDLIINSIFNFAMVDKKCIKNDEVNDAFYNECQGIISIAVMLFLFTQNAALISNKDKITPKLIREVARTDLILVKPMMEALRSGNPLEIARFDDLTVDESQVLSHYHKDMLLDTRRQELINESILKIEQEKEYRQDQLYSEFYISKLFSYVPNQVMRKIVNDIVKAHHVDEDYDEIKEECHEVLYSENVKRKPKKTVRIGDINNNLINIYDEAIAKKKDPYESLKKCGYIKDPFEEFKIG